IGFAWNCVRFVDKRGNTAHATGKDRRRRGKSAHPEHDLWFEFVVDRTAKRKTFGEAAHEAEDPWRNERRESDRRQFLKPELRPSRECEAVDLFFGNEQQDLVSALPQHFGNRDAGEKMSARPSASDDRVHW